MSYLEKNRRLFILLVSSIALLLIPLIGTIFIDQFDWDAFDFLVAAIILIGFSLLIEFICRKTKPRYLRVALMALLSLFFMLLWAELAVGIFGTCLAGD